MLSYLKVENLAVVEKAELTFSPRLNVLTGETGAGKSILIDAIQLLLNKRIPPHLIRTGKEKLLVEALFHKNEEETLLKREVDHNRSLAFLNGEISTFTRLRELAAELLNIYGQKDHDFLLNLANHQNYLDRFASHALELQQLTKYTADIRHCLQEIRDLEHKNTQVNERVSDLLYLIGEIDQLNLQPGDEERLQERLRLLAAAETIKQKADSILEDLYLREEAVYPLLAKHRADLEYLQSHFAAFSTHHEQIQQFYQALPELSVFLNEMVGKLEYDENELNEIEQKLQKLEKLKAKYRLSLDGIMEKRGEMVQEKEHLLQIDLALREKNRNLKRLLTDYRSCHTQLRESRKKKGKELSAAVEAELAKLEMKKTRFIVKIDEIEPEAEIVRETGTDRIEFIFSSNPGQDPAPLADVASGGELSRLMLVLKSLCGNEAGATFIFDEIDAGIGGRTAEFVGEKLRCIAEENQVICISHLPQIASFAERHFLVTKEFRQNRTFSHARPLDTEERITEIARLMAGSASGEDIRKAAANLLQKNSQ